MVDHEDLDLGELYPTEASPRLNKLYRRMFEWQFGIEGLRSLEDEELVYIAGHRAYVYPRDEGESDSVALEKQQKVRGNAVRAKDELDRRELAKQAEALERSIFAVAESAKQTRWLVLVTIVIALGTIATAIGSFIQSSC